MVKYKLINDVLFFIFFKHYYQKHSVSPDTKPRVSHRPPDCTGGSLHSSSHLGTLWC